MQGNNLAFNSAVDPVIKRGYNIHVKCQIISTETKNTKKVRRKQYLTRHHYQKK